jgi:hypothetical protein
MGRSSGGGGGSGGGITSVFGRSGPAIVAEAGDYTAAQVGAAPGVSPWLAHVSYGPVVGAGFSFTTGRIALSAAHLTIPFTAPASGKVVVTVSAFLILAPPLTAGDVFDLYLALLNHTDGTRAGPDEDMLGASAATAATYTTIDARVNYVASIGGLTAGDAHQYDLAGYYVGTGTPAVAELACDDGLTGANFYGPVEMFVYAG